MGYTQETKKILAGLFTKVENPIEQPQTSAKSEFLKPQQKRIISARVQNADEVIFALQQIHRADRFIESLQRIRCSGLIKIPLSCITSTGEISDTFFSNGQNTPVLPEKERGRARDEQSRLPNPFRTGRRQ